MQRVLITGISGFVGTHLARHLSSLGDQVFGIDKFSPSSGGISSRVELYQGNLGDQQWVTRVLAEVKPQVIYHLAGVIKADDAREYFRANVLDSLSLFEAIAALMISPRVLVASSSAVYGAGWGSKVISEVFKPRPLTHYALSKLALESLAFRYQWSHGIEVICTRTFNLIGPGQSRHLACSQFAYQIAQAERTGGANRIITGDLSAQRDFCDVRDAVRAYHLLAALGKAGAVYNVCSGKAVSIQHCLELLLGMARLPLEVVFDPARRQAQDVPIQVGSATRLQRCTGWKPEIPLQQSLADLLDHWRETVHL